jgi:crotonobetainyl-CoA:carnitine CoA-transferase CaiB-like acyl-CoA transferase
VDLALLDVTAATLANQASNFLVGGIVPGRMGNAHPNVVPYQAFATAEGHCIVAVGNDSQFRKFSQVIGLAELADDERFATNRARVANRDALVPLLQERLLQRSRDRWLEAFEAAGVPAGPINNIDEVLNDPQVLARGMRVKLPHPDNPALEVVGNPIKLSRTPVTYERHPPRLGEHDDLPGG